MSMLPSAKSVPVSGYVSNANAQHVMGTLNCNNNNNLTANSFSDRHSFVSGTAPFHQEPSDVEFLSIGFGGGPPSEGGSFFDTSLNAQDERRELELAYKDLYNQVHGKALQTSGGRMGNKSNSLMSATNALQTLPKSKQFTNKIDSFMNLQALSIGQKTKNVSE